MAKSDLAGTINFLRPAARIAGIFIGLRVEQGFRVAINDFIGDAYSFAVLYPGAAALLGVSGLEKHRDL